MKKKMRRKEDGIGKVRGGKRIRSGKANRAQKRAKAQSTHGFRKRRPRRSGYLTARTQALADAILEALARIQGPMSTRQVFYQCVSRQAVENTEAGYSRVARLLVWLRRNGTIPYERIVDRTRSMHRVATWDSLGEAYFSLKNQYRRDPWQNQNVVPFIGIEKDALAGIVENVVDSFAAPLAVTRGYPSLDFLHNWAMEIRVLNSFGKRVRVFYFGDFDSTGIHIPQTIEEELRSFGAEFEFQVAGLLKSDIVKFKLLPGPLKKGTPEKKGDTRAEAFEKLHGNRVYELDALPADELRRRVQERIESCIDQPSWQIIEREELSDRKELDANIEASGYKPTEPPPKAVETSVEPTGTKGPSANGNQEG